MPKKSAEPKKNKPTKKKSAAQKKANPKKKASKGQNEMSPVYNSGLFLCHYF